MDNKPYYTNGDEANLYAEEWGSNDANTYLAEWESKIFTEIKTFIVVLPLVTTIY